VQVKAGLAARSEDLYPQLAEQRMNRERTYSWGDPAVLAAAALGLDGFDFLSRIGSGELPIVPASARRRSSRLPS
jgi:hypothetical protein